MFARAVARLAPALRARQPQVVARSMSGGSSQHRHSEDNNAEVPFDFTAKNYERVATIMAKYPSA